MLTKCVKKQNHHSCCNKPLCAHCVLNEIVILNVCVSHEFLKRLLIFVSLTIYLEIDPFSMHSASEHEHMNLSSKNSMCVQDCKFQFTSDM